MQSQDERDMEGIAARKERDASVKEFAGEEITDRYEGEELVERRAQRPPEERFNRLEHVTLTAELVVDRAQKLAKVEVEKEAQLDRIEAKKTERADTIDAKKTKRAALLQGLAWLAGGGGLVEPRHKLGVL